MTVVLYEHVAFSIAILSTEKHYSSFLKEVFVLENLFRGHGIENVQNLQGVSHENIPMSWTEGYFENP